MNIEDHLTPEVLVPRIGEYLLEKGLISAGDLQRALMVQEELKLAGQTVQIGSLLVSQGLVDRPTLDQVVTEQIIQLRAALQDANQQLEQRVMDRTAELQVALKKLSELNQLKTNIISNVSHELRTPMTYIVGYLDLLSTGVFGDLSEDQLKTLNIIKRSTDRLNNLINDLIRFSASSQGDLELNIISLEPTLLAQNSIKAVRRKAIEKSISLEVNLPTDLPPVSGDQEGITWVLTQLLDNAIKFTPANGRIVLSVDLDANFIKFSVSDNGIGIPADRIEEIFIPFHQLDESSTRHYGGTGLGLALVRQIIEAHGSIVRVNSQVGKGSNFEFFLPVVTKVSDAKRNL